MDSKKLGLYVAERRKRLGISQKDLSNLLSYSPQSISLFEKGDMAIPVSLIPLLADGLRCSIKDLLEANNSVSLDYANEPFNSEEFSLRISNIRTNYGKTQNDEAIALKISLRTIRNYEKGISTPTTDFLYRFSDLYQIDPASLFVSAEKAEKETFIPKKEKQQTKSRNRWIALAIAAALVVAGSITIPISVYLINRFSTSYVDRYGQAITATEFYAEEVPEFSIVSDDEYGRVSIGQNDFVFEIEDSTFFQRHTEYEMKWSVSASESYVGIAEPSNTGSKSGFTTYITCSESAAMYDGTLITVDLYLEDTYNSISYYYTFPCFTLNSSSSRQLDSTLLPGVTGFSLPFSEFATGNPLYTFASAEYKTYELAIAFAGTTSTFNGVKFNFETCETGLITNAPTPSIRAKSDDTTQCLLTFTSAHAKKTYTILTYFESSNGHVVYASPLTNVEVI